MLRLNQAFTALCALTLLSTVSLGDPADMTEDIDDMDEESEVAELVWPEAEFASPENRSRGFLPGESFKFRTQWKIWRKLGTSTVKTETVSNDSGETRLSVTSSTVSHGLANKLFPIKLKTIALLDPKNWRLTKASMHGKEGKRLRDFESIFDYDEGVMRHVDQHYPDRSGTRKLPYPVPLDDTSALLQIRGWDMTIGAEYPLLLSSKGKLYLLKMKVTEKESIKTKFGQREAYRIEPISAYPESKLFREGGHLTVWISADEQRIPLRFDVKTGIGLASMILEEFEINEKGLVAEK